VLDVSGWITKKLTGGRKAGLNLSLARTIVVKNTFAITNLNANVVRRNFAGRWHNGGCYINDLGKAATVE
jgi:hypothetical protein